MIQLERDMLDGIPRTGPTDPIEYYRRPLVGWLFRERINRGLRLLGQRRFNNALEIGYGAGAVQLALAPRVGALAGIDLDADPLAVQGMIGARGHRADLRQGTVYDLPWADHTFDLAVSFSVFEHLDEFPRALDEVRRVLAPDGLFLLGMPAVNRWMEWGFAAIGFRGIEDHHVTTPLALGRALPRHGLRVRAHRHLDIPLRRPLGLRLYYAWLLEKTGAQT